MPITEKTHPEGPKNAGSAASLVSQDEQLAATVSAYLDGELTGQDLAEFEMLLRDNEALSREVAEMRRIDHQLTGIGADILEEPIPGALLEALSPCQRQ
ncbi:MAG: anti-sigma factor family protein [Rhodomicrobium sp.]